MAVLKKVYDPSKKNFGNHVRACRLGFRELHTLYCRVSPHDKGLWLVEFNPFGVPIHTCGRGDHVCWWESDEDRLVRETLFALIPRGPVKEPVSFIVDDEGKVVE